MLIAVDGGATHCRFALFNANGERVFTHRLMQPASLTLGVEEAFATVRMGLAALESASERPLAGIPLVCGLAGSLRAARRQAFSDHFSGERAVEVLTDGHAQLLGVSAGEPGACLAVGTGSVLHWQNDDGVFGMAGGWGYPAGDQASAAWLGLQLLQHLVESRDRRLPTTPLIDAIQGTVGCSTEQVQAWTTSSRSSTVARLAPLLSRFHAEAEPTAMQIVERGLDECERLYACAPVSLPRWICGGLAELYHPGLEQRGIHLQAVHGDALDGLKLHAQSQGLLREA